MTGVDKKPQPFRTDEELAQMIVRVARSVPADVIICGTETGSLFRHVQRIAGDLRLVAATPTAETHGALVEDGFDVSRLSVRVANKYRQARHAVSVALNTGKVSPGDLVVCAVGHNLCHGAGDFLLVTDVEKSTADIALSELVKLTDGIRPTVLEAALEVAGRMGRAARRGKRVGALIALGDSEKVLEGSKQLILNPFQGHEDVDRMLTNPSIHEMLVELAKLDGAFIVRGGRLHTDGRHIPCGVRGRRPGSRRSRRTSPRRGRGHGLDRSHGRRCISNRWQCTRILERRDSSPDGSRGAVRPAHENASR